MPVVRWGRIDEAGGIGSMRCQGEDVHGGSRMTAGVILSPACLTRGLTLRFSGSMPCEMSTTEPVGTSSDPLEFWALLSLQGTSLVAFARARDVLGWGTSELIGRIICAMVRDSRSGIRELSWPSWIPSRYVFPFRSLSCSYREFTSSFPALVRVGE